MSDLHDHYSAYYLSNLSTRLMDREKHMPSSLSGISGTDEICSHIWNRIIESLNLCYFPPLYRSRAGRVCVLWEEEGEALVTDFLVL